ncbi:ribosomal protein S18-alanine N-acetyltransferase [Maricaulis sp.]|uniref:ribosomal protein S18-alanine N-acetyltransferase n=1 Tax=Maricaulis sp. TaxID=1486257 RepID=UPI00261A1477|nr:ribosomal protein S18-alanine N-acetyltransferase [Maricaulis sp.]
MIERLTAASARRLAAVHGRCFDHSWSEAEFASLLHLSSSIALGKGDAGILHGFVLARVAADEAEILTIGVDPDQRRGGCGQALLKSLHEYVRKQGVVRVFLEVSDVNTAARALYERNGYTETGRRARYYRDGSDALVLEKTLSGRGQTPG